MIFKNNINVNYCKFESYMFELMKSNYIPVGGDKKELLIEEYNCFKICRGKDCLKLLRKKSLHHNTLLPLAF